MTLLVMLGAAALMAALAYAYLVLRKSQGRERSQEGGDFQEGGGPPGHGPGAAIPMPGSSPPPDGEPPRDGGSSNGRVNVNSV